MRPLRGSQEKKGEEENYRKSPQKGPETSEERPVQGSKKASMTGKKMGETGGAGSSER